MKQGRSSTEGNYRAPQGPKGIDDRAGPGLHGDNEGKAGEQSDGSGPRERHQSSGRPGLGGTNHGNSCYQGKH